MASLEDLRHSFSGLQRAVWRNPILSDVVSAFSQLDDRSMQVFEKIESGESKVTPHGHASLPISSPLHPRVRTRVPISSAEPHDLEQQDHSPQEVQPAEIKLVTYKSMMTYGTQGQNSLWNRHLHSISIRLHKEVFLIVVVSQKYHHLDFWRKLSKD